MRVVVSRNAPTARVTVARVIGGERGEENALDVVGKRKESSAAKENGLEKKGEVADCSR